MLRHGLAGGVNSGESSASEDTLDPTTLDCQDILLTTCDRESMPKKSWNLRAVLEWHAGEIISCHATMAEAISLAKELRDMHALAEALCWAAVISYGERDPAEVERYDDMSEPFMFSSRYQPSDP
jgi:hypothetical protein